MALVLAAASESKAKRKLCLMLVLARAYGASIIWTAHNRYRHDKNSWPLLDRLAEMQ